MFLKENGIQEKDNCQTTRCFGNQIIKYLENGKWKMENGKWKINMNVFAMGYFKFHDVIHIQDSVNSCDAEFR